MQANIRSLPTREDMDKYVYRLETSYKSELQMVNTSVQKTLDKVNTLDTRLSVMEQKMGQEQYQSLKFVTTTILFQVTHFRSDHISDIGNKHYPTWFHDHFHILSPE